MIKFERDRRFRIRKYADANFEFGEHPALIEQLERDGFAVIRKAVDRGILLEIRRQAEGHLDSGTCLLPISKDSIRGSEDLTGPKTFLTSEEVRKGSLIFDNRRIMRRSRTRWFRVRQWRMLPFTRC